MNRHLIVISVCLIFNMTLEVGAADAPRIPVESLDLTCQADEDCVAVDSHCGGCACPGAAINKAMLLKYDQLRDQTCREFSVALCERYCGHYEPRCLSQKCELIKDTYNFIGKE